MRSVINIVVVIAMVLGLSWALSSFVFKAYEIPSGSMETTIMPGDRLFSEKVTYYFEEPSAGDVVTFNDPQIPFAHPHQAGDCHRGPTGGSAGWLRLCGRRAIG